VVPTLDLTDIEIEEVENEVEKFLSAWVGKHLFTYFVIGDSKTLSQLVLKVVTAKELEYMTDMPGYPGKIRVVMM